METKSLLQTVTENAVFVAEFLGIVVLMVVIAYLLEKAANKKSGKTERILTTRKVVVTGMFAAIAGVLMSFEIPVPFAPPFYKIDFSEIPALIGTFAFGPVSGVMIEFCKNLIKIILKSSDSAFVGELANFVVGCSFILPASAVYMFHKTKKTAVAGVITGTLCMTIFGTMFNAVYLLPKFAQLYGVPMDVLIEMGKQANGGVNGVISMVILCVAPLNLLKGGSVSLITMLVYKKLSPILKTGHSAK